MMVTLFVQSRGNKPLQALLFDADGTRSLQRTSLKATDGHDEKWLQALLFQHPGLIPIDQIDPGAGQVVPICRELAIPKEGSTVFLDMLGVTEKGRLVLIECKLWRNPQARREVIAQILEYAALLRQWSYADLTARLTQSLRWTGPNPLYAAARQILPSLDEVRFVEGVSRSLLAGDFDLIVAGDGIRSDLQAIAGHLNGQVGLAVRLALVEFQLWTAGNGQTLVVPSLSLRTHVVEHRVVVDGKGVPLSLIVEDESDEVVETLVYPDRGAARDQDRAFWQRFIDGARFDHPDQSPSRHGGRNWVKMDLPAPTGSLTAFRAVGGRAGLFIVLRGEFGATTFAALVVQVNQLRQETGLNLSFTQKQGQPFRGDILALREATILEPTSDDRLLIWLGDAANRMINAFRPRLSALAREGA
jgi:hypothetical protein